MVSDKYFLTYNQQMKKLRNDKQIDCHDTEHKEILVRAGYFNLINGYKLPFTCGTLDNGNHQYIPDTSINQLYSLKKFDDNLRIFLLKYITQVEEEVRTLTGYKFDQFNNNGKIPWYDINAFESSISLQNKMETISSAYSEMSKSQLDYVQFYMREHKQIPTWIMVKAINFSTFINVLNYSKKEVKHSICKLYGLLDDNELPNVKLLIGSLHWMRKVRNSCAHNERIYCLHQESSKSRNNSGRIAEKYFKQLRKSYLRDVKEKRIFDIIVYMKYYLPKDEFDSMVNELTVMLEKLKAEITEGAFENVRSSMGIKDLEDLNILNAISKDVITYNKFDTFYKDLL